MYCWSIRPSNLNCDLFQMLKFSGNGNNGILTFDKTKVRGDDCGGDAGGRHQQGYDRGGHWGAEDRGGHGAAADCSGRNITLKTKNLFAISAKVQ